MSDLIAHPNAARFPPRRKPTARGKPQGATLGFEERLWRAAETLRGHVEPAEYKHIVLGLLFLKYVVDTGSASLTDKHKSRSPQLIVPPSVTWDSLVDAARKGKVTKAFTIAFATLERDNAQLRGLLGLDLRRIDEERLGSLAKALGDIAFDSAVARDMLGRVYEYFLAQFASSEGRSGGEYYTPRSVVQLLVEMAHPFAGILYDPCCGTAGMFVQSDRFLAEHGLSSEGLIVIGQESSPTTWRLAKMNLALRGIKANLGHINADTFLNDLHHAVKANFILANPPFNARNWGADRLANDSRWKFGVPPRNNANYAWLQHILARLADDGLAGVVLANGSLSSDQAGEGCLRANLVEADMVECIVTLPSQLFYGTQIPACLWFISPTKTRNAKPQLARHTLFIDARSRGHLVDRVHAELSRADIDSIAGVYRRWRGEDEELFSDIPGFARSVSTQEIRRHKYALVSGRYVGFQRDRASPLGRAMFAAEIAEARSRLAEIDNASKQFLLALETLGYG